MVIVHGLRILTDLSFYYAFAAFVSVCYGGRYALIGLLLQTACFTLSAMLRKKKWLRLAALLPMVLLWLLPDVGLADRVLFLPPAAYLLWQAYTDTYPLVWSRHVELFSVFWKCYVCFAFFMLLTGMLPRMSAASIPIALIMLVGSVLLMRTLRHEPETYCQRRYQVMNLTSVAAVAAVAAVMSTETFLQICSAAFHAVYNSVVVPVLLVALVGVVYVLRAAAWLVSLLNIELPQSGENVELQLDGIAKDLGLDEMTTSEPVGRELLILLGIVIAGVLLYLFFRWMVRLGWLGKPPADTREERREAERQAVKAEKRPRPGSAVQRVRAQYRKFLKLYVSAGGELNAADTSLDVDKGARRCYFDPKASAELREIYIRARYAEQADGQDAVRAKELCAGMKKERR